MQPLWVFQQKSQGVLVCSSYLFDLTTTFKQTLMKSLQEPPYHTVIQIMSHAIVVFSHYSGRKPLLGLLVASLLMPHIISLVTLQLLLNQEI